MRANRMSARLGRREAAHCPRRWLRFIRAAGCRLRFIRAAGCLQGWVVRE